MNNSDAEQVDRNWNPVDKMQTVRTSLRQNVYWCRPDVVMNQVQPSEILSLGSVADGGRQCVYAAGWRVKHQPVQCIPHKLFPIIQKHLVARQILF